MESRILRRVFLYGFPDRLHPLLSKTLRDYVSELYSGSRQRIVSSLNRNVGLP